MADFFAELKRRHIYRVGAGYVIVAWAITQLVDVLSQVFALPPDIGRPVLIALAIGLPLALIVAWIVESKPHAAVASAVRSPSTAVDWALFGAVAVVIGLIGYQQTAPASGGRTEQPNGAVNSTAISVAVLPFVNLSGDTTQEFFSDGMTEEITSALAKVPSLQVVGRTSAFQFKGENKDLRAIGQALSATHLIEGSVRKVGERVRITAQLIRADNGLHLWTENFDRELKDIFATQEDIAQAIAASLQVPLGLTQGQPLVANRTKDLEAYEEFLRARAVFRTRAIDDSIKLLESVVQRDPEFGPAWGLLANAYGFAPYFDTTLASDPFDQAQRKAAEVVAKAENAAREAIRLDPRSAGGYAGLGLVQVHKAKHLDAAELYQKAIELDPNDPDVLNLYSQHLAILGYFQKALPLRAKLKALEPFVPIFNLVTAGIMQSNGDNEGAIALLESLSPVDTYVRNFALARGYAVRGQFAKAADTLLLSKNNIVARRALEDAARLIRTPVQSDAPEKLPSLDGDLNFVYAYVGAAGRLGEFPERQLALGLTLHPMESVWLPLAAPFRKTERFKTFARKAGYVEYWRTRGWPDLCKPMGADDFVCE